MMQMHAFRSICLKTRTSGTNELWSAFSRFSWQSRVLNEILRIIELLRKQKKWKTEELRNLVRKERLFFIYSLSGQIFEQLAYYLRMMELLAAMFLILSEHFQFFALLYNSNRCTTFEEATVYQFHNKPLNSEQSSSKLPRLPSELIFIRLFCRSNNKRIVFVFASSNASYWCSLNSWWHPFVQFSTLPLYISHRISPNTYCSIPRWRQTCWKIRMTLATHIYFHPQWTPWCYSYLHAIKSLSFPWRFHSWSFEVSLLDLNFMKQFFNVLCLGGIVDELALSLHLPVFCS